MDLHFTKKDFRLEWYSGSGAGGQHRNKHQNCCRITHLHSGITVRGTRSRSRIDNQREAFSLLASKVIAYYQSNDEEKNISNEVIRNYHAVRNEVKDKASGITQTYKHVVIDRDIGDMIVARARAILREATPTS